MIFVTVGTQAPFDRLVRTVDQWAADHHEEPVFAQIGETALRPSHIQHQSTLSPDEFNDRLTNADAVVAHAGIGTITRALEVGKPVLVMPRRAELREHRNDHQIDTVRHLGERAPIHIAYDEGELLRKLNGIKDHRPDRKNGDSAAALIRRLRTFTQETIATADPDAIDGVICFGGEDWWYHNRGHYDMQLMKALRQQWPTLYVNSIGVRSPSVSEGAMFVRRLARKARSFTRGLQEVDDGLSVYSPVTSPGMRRTALGQKALVQQVRHAAHRMGIEHPLVWVACPSAAPYIDALEPAAVVYQRTDRFEALPGIDAETVAGYDRQLKERADATLFCSSLLFEDEREQCRSAAFVDHGVDYDRFAEAGRTGPEPDDVTDIARPRVGFVGGIDAHTFDPDLFRAIVKRLPDHQFVLVGACSLPEDWCNAPNVHQLGQKPYEEVPAYMAACDVLIMPWNQSKWIEACNPVKLKEYLAVGRPVISRPFAELERYRDYVDVAVEPEAFADAIRAATSQTHDPEPGRERVAAETWSAKADAVLHEIRQTGAVDTD